MQKIATAVSILLGTFLTSASPGLAQDRHQVTVEMLSGQPLLVDMDEWAVTSLLVMDFAFDEMEKVADPANQYSKEMQLFRLRSASAVVLYKSRLFGRMAYGTAEAIQSPRTRELSSCNLALEDIDKTISNTVQAIRDEATIFDPVALGRSFHENLAQCAKAVKEVK